MSRTNRNASLRSALITLVVTSILVAIIGCGGGGGGSSTTNGVTNGSTNANTNGISNSSTASTNGNTNGSTNGNTNTTGDGAVTTLNFDNLPAVSYISGTAVPEASRLSTQFLQSNGVRFTSGAGYVAVVQLPEDDAPSQPNAISGTNANGQVSYGRANPIEISFFDPADTTKKGVVKYFSLIGDKDSAEGNVLRAEAYDVNGRLLHVIQGPDQFGTNIFFEAQSPVIHRVVILGSQGETNGIAIDNIGFKPVVRAR